MSLTSNTTISTIPNETTLGHQNLPCSLTPNSTVEKIAKVCAYCVILLGGFFGNIFIIMIVYKHRELRKTVNYFIVNMAVSDLLLSLMVIVFITGLLNDSWQWNVRGILGSVFCKLFHFANPVSLVVSSQSLVWIAIDRFVAIVFPIKLGLISNKFRAIAIVSTWIIAGLLNFPKLIIWGLVEYGNETYCSDIGSVFTNQEAIVAYIWLQMTSFFFVPLFFVCILYTAIAISLKRQSKALADTTPSVQRHSLNKRTRAIQMTFVIVVLFYICVSPYALLNIIPFTHWRPSCSFQRLFMFLAIFMLHLTSIVNPIICLSFVESYRHGLRNILCPCSRIRNNRMAKCEQITQKKMNALAEEGFRRTSKDYEGSLETVL